MALNDREALIPLTRHPDGRLSTPGAAIIITPHPVCQGGQRVLMRTFTPGETLGQFLARTVPDWRADEWEVRVDGYIVPPELVARIRPKDGTYVEVRSTVHRAALAIIALAALTYFTFGIGTAGGALLGATAGYGALGSTLITSAVYVGGTVLINKVLGPKMPKLQGDNDPVYSITSARNQIRHYQPLPLLFGKVRIAPDIISAPYTSYQSNDQYISLVLTPGVNVHRIEALHNGDTPLSSYEGVSTYLNGFGYHANQPIPLWSNVDMVSGAELEIPDPDLHWVERTSSADAVALVFDFEYTLYELSSKGKFKPNTVPVYIQHRLVGAGSWTDSVSGGFITLRSDNSNVARHSQQIAVAQGQYETRVRLGVPATIPSGPFADTDNEERDECKVTWVALKTVQPDTATYAGIPRIGLRVKATGQLNGSLDEVRCVAHSSPCPVWNGSSWVTQETSNPGAHLLLYARGIRDGDGKLIAGIGLADSQIDIPALQAFMVHCAANGYKYDGYIKDARNHQTMTDAIALAGFGQTTWAGGKFSVVWAAQGQPITAVAGMANIKRGSFQINYALASTADGVEYTYVDGTDWQTKTLRVPAPGVVTMLNPAQITGEGVTTEAHAAEMARWHLAQSLYQYKDISFAQDLEHLSYRRLSVLSISHDLTQWGYSGRVRAAVDDDGTVTLTLDEPVPAPSSGTPYIGLRVPGEGAYRVFPVAAFVGESDELELVGTWPSGVQFPGDDAENPAHDTLWCYDFKATPGARVRVVQIEPESDMRGARVAVVPETEEFWTFVKTGDYIPSPNISLLVTAPTASNVHIDSVQTVRAGIAAIELAVSFDVSGPMDYAVLYLDRDAGGEWIDGGNVVTTRATTARMPVPGPGLYRVRVLPFNSRGVVGTAASGTHTVVDVPVVTGTTGTALNRDPFMLDEDAWEVYSGAAVFETITDGVVGTGVARSPAAGITGWMNGRDRIPVDPNKTYRASMLIRTVSGAGNVAYAGVALFDADGENIAGDGAQWYYVASNVTPPGTFTRYSGTFGNGTAKPFPAEARTMAPLFILSYDPGGGPHTSVHEIQDLRIEDAGATGLVPFLTNESHTLPASSTGVVASYAGATGSFKIYAGGVDVSASFALSTQSNPQNLTVGYSGQTYTVSAGLDAGEPGATLVIRATGSGAYAGVVFDKAFTLSKSLAGAGGNPGADAKLLYVIADRQTIYYDGTGAPSPSSQTVTFTAQKVNTTATAVWSITDIAGNALTPVTSYLSADAGNSVTMSRAQFDAAIAIHGTGGVIVTASLTDGVTLSDKVSVLKVSGGAQGPQGSPGNNGAPGAPGADGQRGSKQFYASGSAWSDSTANGAVAAAGLSVVLGDQVTIHNNAGFAETRVWTGSAWSTIGEVINGALIAKGTIFADALAVLSSNGQTIDAQGGRITWSNGVMMKVVGVGFGSSNQFIEWYGPYFASLSNCTEANGVSWLKTNGDAYFGGSLSAGTLTTKASTSSTSATAEVETSVYGSNGGTITVTLSYLFYSTLVHFSGGSESNGSNSASIYLYRKVGAGGYSHVATLNASGTWEIVDHGMSGMWQTSACAGSITYTDPQNIASDRQYRAVINSRSVMSFGSIDQNIGIISVEE